jgi:hypothetical protein
VNTGQSEERPVTAEPESESVIVPRALARDMSAAIEAMQVLASDAMLDVAKALGLVARRRPHPPLPDCSDCGLAVGLGLPHDEQCASDEALRYQLEDIPQVEDEA